MRRRLIMSRSFQILIVGGGNGGLSVASRLRRQRPGLQIAIVEPSDKHYYQPAWTLVGGGAFDISKTERDEVAYIPDGVEWIRDKVAELRPDSNSVVLGSGEELKYEWIVLSPGIQLNWHLVQGLKESLGTNGIVSNYGFDQAPKTWQALQEYRGGPALFTSPNTPIKCGGAPQKIMYLAADYFRKMGKLSPGAVQFTSGGTVLFGVEKYRLALEKVVERNGIQLALRHNLVAIDASRKVATYDVSSADGPTTQAEKEFEMIHVVPPQSAPDFIKTTSLVNAAGWIEVDKNSLRHVRFANVFALGDATNTPNAKTGAAIRKQAPVLVANLLSAIDGSDLSAIYTGYGSCPLVTGYGKLILAEFDYENKPVETFPFNQAVERYSMWLLKRYVLPTMYWNGILQGRL